MATVREGSKPVLLIVDVQVGVMRESWDAPRIINNVSRIVERARAELVPVIWLQHSDEQLPHGSPEWRWVPELEPSKDEPLIHKRFNSSLDNGARIEAAGVVQELNIAMKWLSYPGRVNGIAAADEVSFATPGGSTAT